MIRTTPAVARRRAYGSFEPDGIKPTEKNDKIVSNLSASAKSAPTLVSGRSPSAEFGR